MVQKIADKDLLQDLERIREKTGHRPRACDVKEHGKYSLQPYQSHWGSWSNALDAAGMELDQKPSVSDEDLLDELRRLAEDLDRTPSTGDIDELGEFSPSTYLKRWESICSAREKAGLEPEIDTTQRVEFTCDYCGSVEQKTPSEAKNRDYCSSSCANKATFGVDPHEILSRLESLAEELGRPPSSQEFDRMTEYWHGTLGNHFGSYSEAIREIGLEPSAPKDLDDEQLLSEINRLSRKVDDMPTTSDLHSHGRWSCSPFVKKFGSWVDALEKAGFEPAKDGRVEIDRGDLVNDMERVAGVVDNPPSYNDIAEFGLYSPNTYEREFGSFLLAKEAAGFDAKPSYHNTREHATADLISELKQLAEFVEGVPNSTDIMEHSNYSVCAFTSRFGSWPEAVRQAGFDPEPVSIPDEELIEELQALADRKGRPPIQSEMIKEGEYSASVYYDSFGSWLDAKEEAGLDREIRQLDRRISKSEALNALQKLADELGRAPSYYENQEMGSFSTAIYKQKFGTWSAAKDAAGLDPSLVTANAPSGKEHYAWKEGPRPYYGSSWQRKRQRALERDNNQCRKCEMSNRDHKDEFGVSLHVHHIKPAREFDDHKERNKLENLVTLCAACHKKWEKIPVQPQMAGGDA